MLTIGSLFSGIGGLELGLEWAGLGPVKWQCEINPFSRSVLAKHWPNVTRFEDVQEERTYPVVDLVCGGFPCQDTSPAGSGEGLHGKRSGLWWPFARVVDQVRPRYVVVENVAGGARRWLPQVRRCLYLLGYESTALAISASDVGAPHLRRRIFIVAYAIGDELRHEPERGSARWPGGVRGQGQAEPGDDGAQGALADGSRERRGGGPEAAGSASRPYAGAADSRQALADGDRGGREGERLAQLAGQRGASRDESDRRRSPGLLDGGLAELADGESSGWASRQGLRGRPADDGREVSDPASSGRQRTEDGRERAGRSDTGGGRHGEMADAAGPRREGPDGHERSPGERGAPLESQRYGDAGGDWGTLEPGLGGVLDGVPPRVDRWPSRAQEAQGAWEPPRAIHEPGRIPARSLRLKAIGNAVVPQCAEVVGRVIVAMERERRRTRVA